MHLCLTVECITSGLHLSVFELGHTPPVATKRERVEEQGTWASRTRKHSEAGYGRPVDRGAWTAKTVKRHWQQPAQPQSANYWAPLTRKRHTSRHIQHSPGTPTTGLRECGTDTSRSTGRSGRQNAATRRNMRREERVTVQGPVKKQQPDGMPHRGRGYCCCACACWYVRPMQRTWGCSLEG